MRDLAHDIPSGRRDEDEILCRCNVLNFQECSHEHAQFVLCGRAKIYTAWYNVFATSGVRFLQHYTGRCGGSNVHAQNERETKMDGATHRRVFTMTRRADQLSYQTTHNDPHGGSCLSIWAVSDDHSGQACISKSWPRTTPRGRGI